MFRRYSIRNLSQDAIDMLAEIKAEERREIGAILEQCIVDYWHQVFYEVEGDAAEAPRLA
jgi:hypothetical protein